MTTMTVPFFDYPALFQRDEAEIMAIVRDVLARGAYILQEEVRTFEVELAQYLGAKHAIGVANCTDALTLCFRACGIEPGDEVILPTHTFVATASAVHHAGGVCVPVDCGPDHLVTAAAIEAAITPRTRFLLPVQLNGRTAAMDGILALAKRHGLTIIEDAAQSLGSTFRGQYAGTFGRASAFSFYPAKLLGCYGDGGAVVTSDDTVAERVRLLRDHGRRDGDVVVWGVNSRLDNLHAAVLLFQLRRFPQAVARRRAIARAYEAGLGDVSQIVLPPGPESDPAHLDVYQNYEIEADRRDDLRAYLTERGIGTLLPWAGRALHQLSGPGLHAHAPFAERMFTRVLMLPMNTALSDAQVDCVIENVRAFYRA